MKGKPDNCRNNLSSASGYFPDRIFDTHFVLVFCGRKLYNLLHLKFMQFIWITSEEMERLQIWETFEHYPPEVKCLSNAVLELLQRSGVEMDKLNIFNQIHFRNKDKNCITKSKEHMITSYERSMLIPWTLERIVEVGKAIKTRLFASGQVQLEQRVVFRFSTLRLRSKK